jgi:hypothetical protein
MMQWLQILAVGEGQRLVNTGTPPRHAWQATHVTPRRTARYSTGEDRSQSSGNCGVWMCLEMSNH